MSTSPLATEATLSDDRRAEIAAFLRARRARLASEQVGLPPGVRRRTPGLRREEVAALAGVSPEWYKWLEQARNVRASEPALRRIAAALKLDPSEVRHLLTLSGYGDSAPGAEIPGREAPLSPYFQRLLDQLEPCPAWVLGARWDILAWNQAATIIFGDLAAMSPVERNALYQMFLTTRFRRTLVNWEAHARDLVAKARLTHARRVDDPWFNQPIRLLHAQSPEFAAWWDDHLVQLPRDGTKEYDHPRAGRLTFDYAVLDVADERFPSLQLVLYLPTPGTKTREKMERWVLAAGRQGGKAAGMKKPRR